MVFVLLGPPNYIRQVPLKGQDDSVQAARAVPLHQIGSGSRGKPTYQYVYRDSLSAEVIQGTTEVWLYRRDRLPAAVWLNHVDFEFTTKEGYGVGVLGRDLDVLLALEASARAMSRRD